MDWQVLGRDGDPAPGDPGLTLALAASLQRQAELSERNTGRLRAVAASQGELRLEGDYAPKFRDALTPLPDHLAKLRRAYRGCGDALRTYASSLEQAQSVAGRALRDGTDADARLQGAVREMRSALPPDRELALNLHLGLSEWAVEASTTGLDEPAKEQVRAAARRARFASSDLDAAKRLAAEAARLRGDAETRCVEGINTALDDSGIKNKAWYQKAFDFVSTPFRSWDNFVDLCKNVAMVAGVVALFVSGPIGMAILAAALLASAVTAADTLMKYRRGEAGLGDVALEMMGFIPGGKVAAGAARLARAAAVLRGGGGRTFRVAASAYRRVDRIRLSGEGPTTVRRLKQQLGRAGMSVKKYDVVHTPEIRTPSGDLAFGRSSANAAGRPTLGKRGRPLIELSDLGLRSMDEAVTTVHHEIYHVNSWLVRGNGGSEAAAEQYGLSMLAQFRRRIGGAG